MNTWLVLSGHVHKTLEQKVETLVHFDGDGLTSQAVSVGVHKEESNMVYLLPVFPRLYGT